MKIISGTNSTEHRGKIETAVSHLAFVITSEAPLDDSRKITVDFFDSSGSQNTIANKLPINILRQFGSIEEGINTQTQTGATEYVTRFHIPIGVDGAFPFSETAFANVEISGCQTSDNVVVYGLESPDLSPFINKYGSQSLPANVSSKQFNTYDLSMWLIPKGKDIGTRLFFETGDSINLSEEELTSMNLQGNELDTIKIAQDGSTIAVHNSDFNVLPLSWDEDNQITKIEVSNGAQEVLVYTHEIIDPEGFDV